MGFAITYSLVHFWFFSWCWSLHKRRETEESHGRENKENKKA
jgi:hypothetical protein